MKRNNITQFKKSSLELAQEYRLGQQRQRAAMKNLTEKFERCSPETLKALVNSAKLETKKLKTVEGQEAFEKRANLWILYNIANKQLMKQQPEPSDSPSRPSVKAESGQSPEPV
ncbi:MAG: hypothetical protein FWF24_02295 [Alphaproteobacteria bacterium]|nr:hypothetical protein [Alphaproteobacteria bacterium]